ARPTVFARRSGRVERVARALTGTRPYSRGVAPSKQVAAAVDWLTFVIPQVRECTSALPIVVEQDPIGRTFQIFELSGAQRPKEERQAASAEHQACPEQIQNHAHPTPLRRRKLLLITRSD